MTVRKKIVLKCLKEKGCWRLSASESDGRETRVRVGVFKAVGVLVVAPANGHCANL